jgi:two-component system response regulator NreC
MLSQREKEVLELVCKGYTNKQIAERLIVSSDTVKAHLASIMRKFNVNNRTLVTRYAIKHKLIDLNAD